jgi:hypothetical protein
MRAEAYDPGVLVRALLASCCAAIAVLLAVQLRAQDRCDAAAHAVFLAPARATASTIARVRGCHDAQALASAAVALERAGRHDAALALARTAVAREPRGFADWVGLAFVERASDPAAAARAVARAKALNPRWPGPAPAAAPAPPAAGGP